MARKRRNSNKWRKYKDLRIGGALVIGFTAGMGFILALNYEFSPENEGVTAPLPPQAQQAWNLPAPMGEEAEASNIPQSSQPSPSVTTESALPTPPGTIPLPQNPSDVPVPEGGQSSDGLQDKLSAAPGEWLADANVFHDPGNRPMIAIVLDDVGVAKEHAQLALSLPPEVTLALMTYAEGVDHLAREARARGHELLVHMPMEPVDSKLDAGPNVLKVGLQRNELQRRIKWGLGRFTGYIGVNNHMGSRFTQNEAGMEEVLSQLRQRHLFFLDSKTIGNSKGSVVAGHLDLPHLARDVFLDNDINADDIATQLLKAEEVARRQGYAIAIGHPHPATVDALKKWMEKAEANGFALVPISYILRKQTGFSG